MLTLDHTTLYYYSLSDATFPGDRHTAKINDWRVKVKKPSGTTRSITPSLTKTSTRSLSRSISSRSALSKVIVRQRGSDVIGVVDSDVPLSDHDETNGPERVAAIKSPLKGKKRVTSSVRSRFNL